MKRAEPKDQFLRKLIQNKNEMNSTPIRSRKPAVSPIYKQGLPQKENSMIAQNHYQDQSSQRKSPIGKLNAGPPSRRRKSTVVQNILTQRSCANHGSKEAQFRIIIDDESFDYCSKCAAHLASQGFQVDKIQDQLTEKDLFAAEQNPRKVELMHFLTSLRNLQGTYRQKLQVLTHINQSYEQEKNNALHFYTAMLDYLQNVREEHLKQIERESIKHTQICEIELGEISEVLQEIGSMKEDVECNLNSIVDEVEQEQYRECMHFYMQKVGIYEHRLQELGSEVREAPELTEDEIQDRLEEFRNFIAQLAALRPTDREVEDDL